MEAIYSKLWGLLADYWLKVVAALIILVVGRWIAGRVKRFFLKQLEKKAADPTIARFVGHFTYILLMAFIVLAALRELGIQTTSFVAVLGAAGLAIGLALRDSLANFAAGFMIILFRPIRVGDFVEAAGIAGIVEEIQIFTTQLRSPDNKTIIVPNSKLMGDNIVNYTIKGTRRVDMVFGIGYGDDIDQARRVIGDVLSEESRILEDPAPAVAVSGLGESSINFVVRPWVNAADYWDVLCNLTEKVKKRFDAEGISIPFPQRDIHIYEHK